MKNEENYNMEEDSALATFFKNNFSGKSLTNGMYSVVVSIIVIVAVIILNLIVGKLELKADLTNDGLYSITDDTKDYLKTVKDKIHIYYITSPAKQDPQMFELVEKYQTLCKSIEVEVKDPVVYPKFVAGYDETVDTINDNSILVVNEDNGKSRYIDYYDIVQTEFSYETYQYSITGVDVEGKLTSGINAVTSDSQAKMYFIVGHNELESFGDSIGGLLSKMNVSFDTIETATNVEIPEDCSILTVFQPTVDYTAEEVEKIKTYIDAGNQMMVMTGVDYNESLPNFESLLSYYGLEMVDGYVVEKNSSNCMNGTATYIKAQTSTENEITADLGRVYTVLPSARGFVQSEALSEYLTIDTFLSSSDYSFSVTDTELSIDDISSKNSTSGPFILGAAITKSYEDTESKIIVIGSSYAFNEDTGIPVTQMANADIIINSVNWLCDLDSSFLAIPVKSSTQVYVSTTTAQNTFWTIILVIAIPVSLLVAGFVVWIVRRKR